MKRTHVGNTIIGLLIMVILLFPLYWIIVSSLKTDFELFSNHQTFLPKHPDFSVYATVFAQQWPRFLSSLIIGCGTVIFSLLISAPAAYALAHFKFKITAIVIMGLLVTQMVPSVILANTLFVLFSKLHLLNTYPGLILADASASIPFAILILRSFMLAIPHELAEAAYVDGAGDWKTFIRIILPVSRPAIITAGLFAFLFSWGDFIFALTVINTDQIQPITLGLYSYIGQHSQEWNKMMATSVLASLPVAALLLFAQKYISSGLSGSVKG